MRTALARGLGISMSSALLLIGCRIGDDHFAECGDGSGDSQGSAGICSSFCEALVDCGTIAGDEEDACVSHCHGQHAFTPASTEEGAACVLDQGCKAVPEYECPNAPFPPLPEGGDGGSGDGGSGDGGTGSCGDGGGGGAGGGSPGDPPDECQADCDCPSGDQCVSGTCETPCNASCDCPTGESCVGGYCELPEEPPSECQADCDCPSGQTCEQGVCS